MSRMKEIFQNYTNPVIAFVAAAIFFKAVWWQMAYAVTMRDRWVYGDWVIHYGTGFVRRGLSGEIVMALSNLTGLDFPQTIILLNLLVVGAIVLLLLSFIVRQRIAITFLLFSPVFLGFYVFDFWIAGKKDLLLVLVFLLFAWLIVRYPQRSFAWCAGLLSMLAVFVFLHEGLAFFYVLPLLSVFLISLQEKFSVQKNAILIFLAIIGAASFFYIFLRHAVSAEQIDMLCMQLGPEVPDTCRTRGAMEALTWRLDILLHKIAVGPYLLVAGLSAGVAFYLTRSLRIDILGKPIPLFIFYMLSYIPVLVLAPFTEDWGRWIALINILYIIFGLIHVRDFLARFPSLLFIPIGLLYLLRLPLCCTADSLDFTVWGSIRMLPFFQPFLNYFQTLFG